MDKIENDQVVYFEISNSFQKLKMQMGQFIDPSLVQFFKIWKHDKGAKKLIQLAIEGDKLLTRQTKNFKKGVKIEKDELSSQFQALKLSDQDKPKIQAMSPKVKKEESPIIQPLNYITQRETQQKTIQIKRQEGQELENGIQLGQGQCGLFLLSQVQVFDKFIKKQQRKTRQYMRGPYKNYSVDIKKKMVHMYKHEQVPISRLSSQYGIPIKNIKRWADYGIQRKEGAGRKRLDPSLQSQLYKKVRDTYPLNSSIQVQSIRTLALKLSKHNDFKASKGWVLGFIERYLLNEVYTIV